MDDGEIYNPTLSFPACCHKNMNDTMKNEGSKST